EEAGLIGFLDVVNRCDVRMIQRGENFGLSLKSAHPIWVTRELFGQNFDRDITLQFRITCAIHFAHPALTEKSANFERAKSCTYIYRHWDITGDAKLLCGALCREAREESNSDRIVQSKPCTQKRFNEVTLLARFHMPRKPRSRKLEN